MGQLQERVSFGVSRSDCSSNASEVGRHIQEGREPSAEEAELATTVCAPVVTYLVNKRMNRKF